MAVSTEPRARGSNRSARAAKLLAACAATAASLAVLAGPANAAGAAAGCTGGSLPGGTYSQVTINGVCLVNAGPVTVTGNLVVTPGSALVAAFGLNDMTQSGNSNLTVDGNLTVDTAGELILGCEPNFFPCLDDNSNTLTGTATVGKNLTGSGALAMIVHASSIMGNVSESGGGGGPTCVPSGPLANKIGPPYSDFENNTVGRNLSISGVQTCWLGALRNKVDGNFNASGNVTFSEDGNELVSNTIAGNMNCSANSPAVEFGDSMGVSNIVGHKATGQCGFNVLAANPEPNGPLTPISVPAG
jgi:hypothetical protein